MVNLNSDPTASLTLTCTNKSARSVTTQSIPTPAVAAAIKLILCVPTFMAGIWR